MSCPSRSPGSSDGSGSWPSSAACCAAPGWVTVTGPGGVGKTRVALRAAAQLSGEFADSACLVELSGLHDPELLPDTIATCLGLPGTEPRSQLDAIIEHLRDQRMLLGETGDGIASLEKGLTFAGRHEEAAVAGVRAYEHALSAGDTSLLITLDAQAGSLHVASGEVDEGLARHSNHQPPATPPATPPTAGLTSREWEIAGLVAEGLSNREIAGRLVISKRTVDAHIEHIYGKLGVSSRVQLASWLRSTRP